MKCLSVIHLKVCVCVWVLCLFVRSRVMATICTFHQKSVECVEPSLSLSLEDRSISNHNRWQCYLNNESKLKQVSQWSRDISHLTGAALDDSRSPARQHAHTQINKHIHTWAVPAFVCESLFFSVMAALTHHIRL